MTPEELSYATGRASGPIPQPTIRKKWRNLVANGVKKIKEKCQKKEKSLHNVMAEAGQGK